MKTYYARRDLTVDIIRGIATVVMTFAHCSAVILNQRQQQMFLVRLAASFAAPLFIFMSGMMVGRSCDTRKTILWFPLLQRSLLLLCISSILLEVGIYGILPFASMDVLSLIGLSLPLTTCLHRLSITTRCIFTMAVFAVTPALQHYFQYRDEMDVWGFVDIVTIKELEEYIREEIPLRMFIDGSFPLFPWLGFAWAGSIFATWRWGGPSEPSKFPKCVRSPNLMIGVFIAILGAALWYQSPGPAYIRSGFCELFYPTTTGYSLTAFGFILMIFSLVDLSFIQDKHWLLTTVYKKLLISLGRRSLFVYLFQYTILFRVLYPFHIGPDLSTMEQLFMFLLIFVACFVASEMIDRVKTHWKTKSLVLQVILGS
jgi:uncharacterized membrane protein